MNKKEIEEIVQEVRVLLEHLNDAVFFYVLGQVLIESDLVFLGNLVKAWYEPSLDSQSIEENYCFTEGPENEGVIEVEKIFNFVEEILNAADPERHIKLKDYSMRLQTKEEIEKEELPKGIVWYTKDKEIDKDTLVAFEML